LPLLPSGSFRHWCAVAILCAGFPAAARPPAGQDFASRLLHSHNAARAAAGVSTLVWDQRLQAEAAGYAQFLARRNVFMHSPRESRGATGENLWMGTRGAFSVESMVGGWLSEGMKFRAGVFPAVSRSGNWQDVGHYTQIVWPQTTRVGCAIASNPASDFLVCRYWPAGNVHGGTVRGSILASNGR
jgi:Cysteine-rich secretory protein family